MRLETPAIPKDVARLLILSLTTVSFWSDEVKEGASSHRTEFGTLERIPNHPSKVCLSILSCLLKFA